MSSIVLKAQAQRLADHLSRVHGVKLKHSAALEALAEMQGAADWNTLQAQPTPSGGLAPGAGHPPAALSEPAPGGDLTALMVSKILESIETGGPLRLGEPQDESMLRRQLARIVQAFPKMSEFWSQHGMPSKVAPRCLCCNQDIYEAPVSVSHPQLPRVHVCIDCAPKPALARNLGVWLIDELEFVAAESLDQALTWYDAKSGAKVGKVGRLAELRSLDDSILVLAALSRAAKSLRQLVTDFLRSGGQLPAVIAQNLERRHAEF